MRGRLQPLLQEAAASLLQPDASGLWPISCPLGLTGGVPLLPVSSAAFTREWVLYVRLLPHHQVIFWSLSWGHARAG
jgi:hypothetical protein